MCTECGMTAHDAMIRKGQGRLTRWRVVSAGSGLRAKNSSTEAITASVAAGVEADMLCKGQLEARKRLD